MKTFGYDAIDHLERTRHLFTFEELYATAMSLLNSFIDSVTEYHEIMWSDGYVYRVHCQDLPRIANYILNGNDLV